MRIIEPNVRYFNQYYTNNKVDKDTIENCLWEHIARCTRICYQSTPRNKETDREFVIRTIMRGDICNRDFEHMHLAMLEHGTVYLRITNAEGYVYEMKDKYIRNNYSKVVVKVYDDDLSNRGIPFEEAFITTNLRVIIENKWLSDLKYICYPTSEHIKRYTFSFTTNIGVSREFNRHRVNSVAEESTRHCNYSKDKFDNQLTFVKPAWLNKSDIKTSVDCLELEYSFDYSSGFIVGQETYNWGAIEWYLYHLYMTEVTYNELCSFGWSAQQAREVLCLANKTELVHTAFEDDWKHFINLRCKGVSGAPHPNAKIVAKQLEVLLKDINK